MVIIRPTYPEATMVSVLSSGGLYDLLLYESRVHVCKTVFERDFNPSNRGPFSFQHYAINHSIHLYALNSLKHIFV